MSSESLGVPESPLCEIEVECLSPTSEGGAILSVEDIRALDEGLAFELERVDEEEVRELLEVLPE